jgi:hypothetical protein
MNLALPSGAPLGPDISGSPPTDITKLDSKDSVREIAGLSFPATSQQGSVWSKEGLDPGGYNYHVRRCLDSSISRYEYENVIITPINPATIPGRDNYLPGT